jgi:hypothetical protein
MSELPSFPSNSSSSIRACPRSVAYVPSSGAAEESCALPLSNSVQGNRVCACAFSSLVDTFALASPPPSPGQTTKTLSLGDFLVSLEVASLVHIVPQKHSHARLWWRGSRNSPSDRRQLQNSIEYYTLMDISGQIFLSHGLSFDSVPLRNVGCQPLGDPYGRGIAQICFVYPAPGAPFVWRLLSPGA